MTRKDYIEVAKILNSYAVAAQESNLVSSFVIKSIADDFADLFANDNPNFDRTRFENAVMK